jgi:hypothetical protein
MALLNWPARFDKKRDVTMARNHHGIRCEIVLNFNIQPWHPSINMNGIVPSKPDLLFYVSGI